MRQLDLYEKLLSNHEVQLDLELRGKNFVPQSVSVFEHMLVLKVLE
jgi:hypothetical protein